MAEVVTDDMPFVVDSVTSGLTAAGLGVHALIHPVVDVLRDGSGRRTDLLDQQSRVKGQITEAVLHVQIEHLTEKAALAEVEKRIRGIFDDVRAAVGDWQPMLQEFQATVDSLTRTPPPLPRADAEEALAFLKWLRAGNFTFLGARQYAYSFGKGKEPIRATPKNGLGVLRDPNVHALAGPRGLAVISDEVHDFLERPELLIVTKTKARSRVHRVVPMDYIGIKRYGPYGKLIGETRFVGLFTAAAYSSSVQSIPYLRAKVAAVIKSASLDPSGHNAKALVFVLDSFPRDEMFQVSNDYLYETAMGILELRERPRIRAFPRIDRVERFASILVYVPRDLHTTDLRKKFGRILEEAFNPEVSIHYTQLGDSPLARIHFILRTSPGEVTNPDPVALEARLREAGRRWEDDLGEALAAEEGARDGARRYARYGSAFPAGYRELFTAREAVGDIRHIERLSDEGDTGMSLYRPPEAPEHTMRFKVFIAGTPVALSDLLPLLEHMGLRVIDERPHRVRPAGGAPDVAWIQDLGVADSQGQALDLERIQDDFLQAFARAQAGRIESDGFNRLVLRAGLDWRQVEILRAIAKYLRQAGIAFSQDYMEDTLAANAKIAAALVELFEVRFDPRLKGNRAKKQEAVAAQIAAGLEAVSNLDEDRILRRFLNVIQAMLRTNYCQRGEDGAPKPHLSLKARSSDVDELPLTKPYAEIFVYSPRMEGVHLRGGRVARGGIRWSDRREDFRTEILGLMKAQMVKNGVIVPVGAKGGFVVKRPPPSGDREAFLAEGIECYRMFMRGLLDITDNQGLKNVKPSRDVVLHDDDPYLVVAADKGTATFSDIANAMSQEYGFWLDDAFASGGSAGYDHKKMGITARGAWESVKRHFRELGTDIQKENLTVVGIGDMSGYVFGNGMLLSPCIRLNAALNHMHIFVDPDPKNPAASLKERRRLFAMQRSAWTDYDANLISKGGGVFARSAKSIPISAEIKHRFGISKNFVPPNDLLRAILSAEVDLLWIGGIGTYVKASDERNAEVGDRANDALRLDGRQLRCKVIGEGGNLGCTQRGRIEFAARGSRLNTDAVDNSAGVDCSDHEVNIKILTGQALAAGDLTLAQRDKLLAGMTDEVAGLCLRDNYLQSQAITVMEHGAPALLDPQARFMRELERSGKLDRTLEASPDDEGIAERLQAHAGLTRPEIAVILAYAKNTLYAHLLESDLPDDSYLGDELRRYFPAPLRKRFDKHTAGHRLRREIIATAVANDLVNRTSASFVSQIVQEGGYDPSGVARAYTIVRESFSLQDLWNGVEALDNKVPAALQTEMLQDSADLIYSMTLWFLQNDPQPLDIAGTVEAYAPGIAEMAGKVAPMLREVDADAFESRFAYFTGAGVSAKLAARVAAVAVMRSACHCVAAARTAKRPVVEVADVFFGVGAALGLDWLRSAASEVKVDSHWQRMAVAAITDDLFSQQRALCGRVLAAAGRGRGKDAIAAWIRANQGTAARTKTMVAEFRATGSVDIARLALANRQVRSMLAAR